MSNRIHIRFLGLVLALALGGAALVSATPKPQLPCHPGDPVCRHCGCPHCPVCPICCFGG